MSTLNKANVGFFFAGACKEAQAKLTTVEQVSFKVIKKGAFWAAMKAARGIQTATPVITYGAFKSNLRNLHNWLCSGEPFRHPEINKKINEKNDQSPKPFI